MQIVRRIILFAMCCIALPVLAQDNANDDEYIRQVQQDLKLQLQRFAADFKQLYEAGNRPIRITTRTLQSDYYSRAQREHIKMLSRNLQSLSVRWDAFTAANLPTMADNDSLMDGMAHIQLIKQAITDTIAVLTLRSQAIQDYSAAEEFILGQDSIYARYYKQAMGMSMIQKLTPQLEKLKAQEQVRFEQIQTHYDKLQAAVQTVPELQKHALKINEHYHTVKALSEKIQAMEYKPIIERIKDYLMGLACVAMILIFINMINSKINAAKKAREAIKQQKEMMLNSSPTDYPTI